MFLQTRAFNFDPCIDQTFLCFQALADLRHSRWFSSMALNLPSCVECIRIVKDLTKRDSAWAALSDWTLELLVERSLFSAHVPLNPAASIMRVMEVKVYSCTKACSHYFKGQVFSDRYLFYLQRQAPKFILGHLKLCPIPFYSKHQTFFFTYVNLHRLNLQPSYPKFALVRCFSPGVLRTTLGSRVLSLAKGLCT